MNQHGVTNRSHQSPGCRSVFAGYPAPHRQEMVRAQNSAVPSVRATIRKIGGRPSDDGRTVEILSKPRCCRILEVVFGLVLLILLVLWLTGNLGSGPIMR